MSLSAYRCSEDTFARALNELRAENEQLRADVAAARCLARPRRWIRLGAAVGWAALFAAACSSAYGWMEASRAVPSLVAEGEACAQAADARRVGLARDAWRHSRDVEERFEGDTLRHAIEECGYANRWWYKPYCGAVVFRATDEFMPWDTCLCR